MDDRAVDTASVTIPGGRSNVLATSKAMRQADTDFIGTTQSAQASTQMQTVMLDAFRKRGGALLKQYLTIEPERLHVGNEHDYLSISEIALSKNVTDADISNPTMLIQKVNARADITLTDTMITQVTNKASMMFPKPARRANVAAGAPDVLSGPTAEAMA